MIFRTKTGLAKTAILYAVLATCAAAPPRAEADTGWWTWQSYTGNWSNKTTGENYTKMLCRALPGQNGGITFVAGMSAAVASHVTSTLDTTAIANAPFGVTNCSAGMTNTYSNGGMSIWATCLDNNGNELEPSTGARIVVGTTYMVMASAAASFNVSNGVISNNWPSSWASASLNITPSGTNDIPGNSSINLPSNGLQSDSPFADPSGSSVHNPALWTSGISTGLNSSRTEAEQHARGGVYIVSNNILVWGMNFDSSIGETIETYNWPQAYEHATWQQSGYYDQPGISRTGLAAVSSSASASSGSGASALSTQDIEMTGAAI